VSERNGSKTETRSHLRGLELFSFHPVVTLPLMPFFLLPRWIPPDLPAELYVPRSVLKTKTFRSLPTFSRSDLSSLSAPSCPGGFSLLVSPLVVHPFLNPDAEIAALVLLLSPPPSCLWRSPPEDSRDAPARWRESREVRIHSRARHPAASFFAPFQPFLWLDPSSSSSFA